MVHTKQKGFLQKESSFRRGGVGWGEWESSVVGSEDAPDDGFGLGASAVGEDEGEEVLHEDAHGGAAVRVLHVVVALPQRSAARMRTAALLHRSAHGAAAVYQPRLLRVVQPVRALPSTPSPSVSTT